GGDRERGVFWLLRGAQEGPAHRAKSQDRQGSADFAAARDGFQAIRDPQAAHQFPAARDREVGFQPGDERGAVDKAPDAFRTISEVAEDLDVPQHVLRFWESRFREIRPMKRGGGRRYSRPDDVELLRGIRHLLYGDGYTIRGVQRILREQGSKFVQAVWRPGAPQPADGAADEGDVAPDGATTH